MLKNNINNNINGTIEIAVPLKPLSNFWRALKMSLINYLFFLNYSVTYIISPANGTTELAITDTKLYISVVTKSNQNNLKLF